MGATDSHPERLGPYVVEGLIRRGGMGVVYRARHTHLNRTVALKILRPEYADDDAFRERFVRESQSAAALHHPNIVTVYDAGEADGLLYIAMQFVDGPDLARVLHRDGPLPAARAMWILDQLAAALEAAHAHGLIHRDVKPGNVLLDNERCYLTDFGLTKSVAVVTAVTAPGQYVGTVHYSSPEQIRGQPLDARADVYALGGMLYRMLAGAVAFPRDDDMSVVHAQLYDDPPRLTDARPDLPPALDEVIFRAIAKDREERYGSCSELAVAANHALKRRAAVADEAPTAVARTPAAGASASADPPTQETAGLHAARWRPRVPSGGVAAALVGIGAAAVIAVIVLSGEGSRKPLPPTPKPHPAAHRHPVPLPTPVIDPPVHVGAQPASVAIGNGGVYVANAGDGYLRRIGLLKSKLDPLKPLIGGYPDAIAVGASAAWVASRATNIVTRLDPTTLGVVARIPVGHAPSSIAIGNGDYAAWVANEQDGTVTRIDANTNSTGVPIKVGSQPHAVATSPHAVFVANRGDGTVTQIDGKTRQVVATIRTGKRPTALVASNNLLWVANAGAGTVVRVDGNKHTVVGSTHVGGRPVALATTRRQIYVADAARGRIIRLDAKTGKQEGSPITVADPGAMRAVAGYLWVVGRSRGTVTRIELF